MGTELDDLYVTLSTREGAFVSGLNKATAASKTAERAMAQIGADASKSFSGVDTAAARTFDGIKRDANGKLRDASGKFVAMGSDAEKAFLQAERAAERAGQRFGGLRSIGDNVRDSFDNVKSKLHATGDEGESSGHRVGSAWGGIGGVIAGLGVAAAGVSFFKGALDEARDAIKVSADTANALKTTGAAAWISAKQVGSLADSLSNYAGVDDEVIQGGANLLLTFSNIKNAGSGLNAIFDRTTKAALDMSAKGFGDMNSASIMLGKALNDPLKGITALQKAGIGFLPPQKAMIESLVKGGDLLGAQKMILEEVEKQVGGTAGAIADPWQRLQVVWGNVKEQVGTALLPVLNKVLTWAADMLPKALGVATRAFGFVAGGVRDFISGFKQGTDAIGSAQSKWAQWGAVVFGVVERVKGIVSAFLYTLRTGFTGDEGTPLERLALAAREVAGVFTDDLMPIIRTVGGFLGDNLEPIVIGVGVALAGMAGSAALGAVIGGLTALVGVLASPIVLLGVLAAGVVFAYQESETFRAIVAEAFGLAGEAISGATDLVVAIGGAIANAVTDIAKSGIGDKLVAIGTDAKKAFDGAKDAIDELAGHIVDAAGRVKSSKFGDAVSGADLPDPGSSSSFWSRTSQAIYGVMGNMRMLADNAGNLGSAFQAGMSGPFEAVGAKAYEVFNGVRTNVDSAGSNLLSFAGQYGGPFVEGWRRVWDDVGSITSGAVEGFKIAWRDMFSDKTLIDMVRDEATNAMSVLRSGFDIGLAQVNMIWSVNWSGILHTAQEFGGRMVSRVSEDIGSVIVLFTGLPGRILGALAGIGGWLFWQGIALLQGMINGIGNMAVHLLISVTDSIWSAVLGAHMMTGDLWPAGRDLMQGMINGVVSMAKHLTTAVTDSISGAINAGKGLLKLRSPSRVFFEMGQLTGKGMELGIIDSAAGVRHAMTKMLAIPNSGAMSVSVAPFAAQNTVRHEVTQVHVVRFDGEIPVRVDGTSVDTKRLVDAIAIPIRNKLIERAPMVGGSLWGTAG